MKNMLRISLELAGSEFAYKIFKGKKESTINIHTRFARHHRCRGNEFDFHLDFCAARLFGARRQDEIRDSRSL